MELKKCKTCNEEVLIELAYKSPLGDLCECRKCTVNGLIDETKLSDNYNSEGTYNIHMEDKLIAIFNGDRIEYVNDIVNKAILDIGKKQTDIKTMEKYYKVVEGILQRDLEKKPYEVQIETLDQVILASNYLLSEIKKEVEILK